MHTSYLGALLLSAWSAQAFKNTSPFLYASTSDLLFSSPQIAKSSSLLDSLSSQLLGSDEATACPTNNYIVVRQPGVAASDFQGSGSMPTLQSLVEGKDKRIRSSSAVPEVIGGLDSQSLEELLVQRCGGILTRLRSGDKTLPEASSGKNLVIVDMPSPSGSGRKELLKENDLALQDLLKAWKGADFTLFYTSTPPSARELQQIQEAAQYEMDDSQLPLHLDLKRDVSMHARDDDVTLVDGPLFERFQFFTPGIFMAMITFFFLSLIGYFGFSALASLEVTYAAFDKENGPQAQKKAQ